LDKASRLHTELREYLGLAIRLQQRGEYGEAQQRYEQSLRIAEELGDRAGIVISLGQIGNLLRRLNLAVG
jgi:tetratricopeptide (TPR) repeat protein